MCGRFSLTTPVQSIAEYFMLLAFEDVAPRYNISPTQAVLALKESEHHAGRAAMLMKWGLIPSWAKDPKIGAKLTNARSETLAEKPSFRGAFKYRRCILPCDGFYEWKREGGRKQPYYFQRADGHLFAFAGLWEHWTGPMGEEVHSCTIVTTSANELMSAYHHRMPVLLEPETFDLWLDPRRRDSGELQFLFQPFPSEKMKVHGVSNYVNYSGNEGRACIEARPEQELDDPRQMNLF